MMLPMIALLALSQTPAPTPPASTDTPGGFPGLPANHTPKVEIAFNRLYDTDSLYAHFDRLAEALRA